MLFTVIRCGYPGHLVNGHVIGRSYLFGDVIHYSCHEGEVVEDRGNPNYRVSCLDQEFLVRIEVEKNPDVFQKLQDFSFWELW